MKQKYRILLCAIVCLSNIKTNAQQESQLAKPSVVPNTIIVKFKSSSNNARMSELETGIEALFKEIGVTSSKQLFPRSNKNRCISKNMGNPKNVDLSSVYEIKYNSSKSMSQIIQQLKKSGQVIYAEPKYIEQAFHIPNDPEAQPNSGQQYHLSVIKAYEAWDIEKGDSNTVIGIVDTDQNIFHPDLKDNYKVNILDPINGIDDDNDGYIDNYRGWDLSNDDNDVTAKAVVVPNKNGKDTTLNGNSHGTFVFGCAGATVNNGIAIAGTGYKCKVLPVKTMDDKNAITGGISDGYPGMIYAAEQGAKVINCSWGSFNSYSSFAQDIINYVTFNFDALVVSAAGNNNNEALLYPCSYENVLCVAASGINEKGEDIKAGIATYSYQVDVCAPGDNIHSTYKDGYTTGPGSSYAAPIVAGAAALVRAKFPNYNALQTLEKIRITADDALYKNPVNAPYIEKLGKGRLDMFRALTETTSPAVRMVNSNLPSTESNITYPGVRVNWFGNFKNFLSPTANLKVTVRSLSPFVEMIDSTINLGRIATLDSLLNDNTPFSFFVKSNTPINHKAIIRIDFEDTNYKDFQYVTAFFNPDFITLDINQIKLTIPSNGRIGFRDGEGSEGLGMIYKDRSLLFESGLILTTNENKISDVVRGANIISKDMSFEPIKLVSFVQNGFVGQEALNEFKDTSSNKVGVQIIQNSFASPTAPNDKFAIIRYLVTNKSGKKIDSLRVGIYSDWDIIRSDRNRADFDATTSLAFTYSSARNGLYAGVALLSGEPVSMHSHDHSSDIAGNINPNDGFTDQEKNLALSRGISKARAGIAGLGADVSQTIGGAILNLLPEETHQIAFAFLAGDNRTDLINSAVSAKNLYNNIIRPSSNIEMQFTNDFNIYPNPANEFLYIQSPEENKNFTLSIENAIGVSLMRVNLSNTSSSIPISNLPKGLYFVKMSYNNKTFVKKILKN